jgi:hypothetical protein
MRVGHSSSGAARPPKKGRIRLGGFTASIWIPALEGYPTGRVRLVSTDPLANKEALAAKILEFLVAAQRTVTVKDVVAALQAQGLAKEPKAISNAASVALQVLKRRKLAVSGGRLWMAAVHTFRKEGAM